MQVKKKSQAVLEVSEEEIGLIMDALDYTSATGRSGWAFTAYGDPYKMDKESAAKARKIYDTLSTNGFKQADKIKRSSTR